MSLKDNFEEPLPEPEKTLSGHPMLTVLRIRNLRFLWLGQGFSVLGTQFYMIALPWLVLRLTGDPFKMGTVLALAGIPRALFMLVGGALTDRFSPRTLMLCSNFTRMVIVGLLTALVLTESVDLWMMYLLGLTFGLADAFYFPAQASIMPRIVKAEHLLAGNSIVQGTSQLSIAVGPALAGGLIAIFSGSPGETAITGGGAAQTADVTGLGLAFGINALGYLISIISLLMIKVSQPVETVNKNIEINFFSSITQGIMYLLKDKTLRLLVLVNGISHFCMEGPLFIGIPVLAYSRFPEGAAAFGIIMSAFGAGMLLGIILAGALPKLPPKSMGMILLIIISFSGLGLMIFGFVTSTLIAALVVLCMATAQGFVVIQYTSWIQARSPDILLGRIFSLIMFVSVGLIPISQALAGALIKFNTTGLFLGAGILMSVVVGLVAFRPEMRSMGLEPKKNV
ncbi:MAG: MFS transporter [Deltaproteobacteria bacterium]|nr:MFS transporter [Deltaproteobacteria bacterium]MBW2051182.1 MFS transporter [Deltaproteobacteria bacterium]MBW2140484.1 MFS transporter [Deltaproteobacteria bacterium]MBW2322208.1 MFS transporter [Deltaproteobacteria bacterium]